MKRILSFVRRWWKRHPMLHPLVAGALVLAVQPATRGRATRFAELAPGEHVVVHYTLHNCGGLTRARITFTGTRAGVRYTATARGAGFRTHTRSGELSRGDAARLDRGIDRFRATRRERCSVEQRVEVTRTWFGVPVSRELHGSRSYSLDPAEMHFSALLPDRG